jgi:hypothetical protein
VQVSLEVTTHRQAWTIERIVCLPRPIPQARAHHLGANHAVAKNHRRLFALMLRLFIGERKLYSRT